MYYVYKVEFPEHNAIYVGCTNNIRRRKDQHNGNSVTGKSYFGRFLKSHGLRISADDMTIIREFSNRKDALSFERETTYGLHGSGMYVLNDNYSDHCSRKGLSGRDNPAAKEYVLIDLREKSSEFVDDVHAWCSSHEGVNYKSLIGTVKGKPHVYRGRYSLMYANDWNNLSAQEKETVVNGDWYRLRLAASESHRKTLISKKYLVQTPNGTIEEVNNLCEYAREHGINEGNLHASATTKKPAAGYRVLERLS